MLFRNAVRDNSIVESILEQMTCVEEQWSDVRSRRKWDKFCIGKIKVHIRIKHPFRRDKKGNYRHILFIHVHMNGTTYIATYPFVTKNRKQRSGWHDYYRNVCTDDLPRANRISEFMYHFHKKIKDLASQKRRKREEKREKKKKPPKEKPKPDSNAIIAEAQAEVEQLHSLAIDQICADVYSGERRGWSAKYNLRCIEDMTEDETNLIRISSLMAAIESDEGIPALMRSAKENGFIADNQ